MNPEELYRNATFRGKERLPIYVSYYYEPIHDYVEVPVVSFSFKNAYKPHKLPERIMLECDEETLKYL